MKQELIKFKLILLLAIILQSCSKDDTYVNLSDEAKDFLIYEIGDTFKLRNVATDEIITLTVNRKEIDYYKESSPGAGWWLGGSGGDDYYERGEFTFSDDTDCYIGTLSVEARSNGNFELTAYLGGCFGNINYAFDYEGEFFPFIEVDGVAYSDAYLLRSYPDILFYSKEKGILKILDDYNQETRFTIVE
uniref:hypothetical protein n=1 Tax=Flavobacterium sp. TaxID=239 RepID=UPI00404B5B20